MLKEGKLSQYVCSARPHHLNRFVLGSVKTGFTRKSPTKKLFSTVNLGASIGTLLTSPSPLSKSHQLRLSSALYLHTCDRLGLTTSSRYVLGSASPPSTDMYSARSKLKVTSQEAILDYELGGFYWHLVDLTFPLKQISPIKARLGLIISTHVIGSASPSPADMCSARPHHHNKYMLGSALSPPTDMCSARSDTDLTRSTPPSALLTPTITSSHLVLSSVPHLVWSSTTSHNQPVKDAPDDHLATLHGWLFALMGQPPPRQRRMRSRATCMAKLHVACGAEQLAWPPTTLNDRPEDLAYSISTLWPTGPHRMDDPSTLYIWSSTTLPPCMANHYVA
ncbi:hypothetical protein Pyn_36414 [Prunus yedoensis var. nudiflora]|uniref:Uncharacterized protein n=1 Tax=Prunus yedoensis var. nudiflora TaxID=2094558 RepID=A0A314Y4I8_PRUYE|nr:hypothetical protein Pyn_36414 [Prunus yedoensis var. nudiflora]